MRLQATEPSELPCSTLSIARHLAALPESQGNTMSNIILWATMAEQLAGKHNHSCIMMQSPHIWLFDVCRHQLCPPLHLSLLRQTGVRQGMAQATLEAVAPLASTANVSDWGSCWLQLLGV
jgi:hypothetical protein